MARRLLITGFEPFGGESLNPSWEVVKRLPEEIGEFALQKLRIPVVFGKAADAVWEAVQLWDPQVVICVGQAGGRCAVTPEKVAINLRNGTDNAGCVYSDMPVVEAGPAAYFSTLPVNAMVEAIKNAELPAAVSYTAGTYVCNDTLYHLLHRCAGSDRMVGFIHIPYLPQQVRGNTPSLPLPAMVQALEAAISAITECVKVFST